MRHPEGLGGGHLPPDRVAACEAGQGTLPELAHLRRCAPCRDEVAAIGRVVGLAEAWRDTPDSGAGGAPLTSWETLAPALRREGLLGDAAGRGAPRHHTPGLAAPEPAAPVPAAPVPAAPVPAAPVLAAPVPAAPVRGRRVGGPWRWSAVLAVAAMVALLLPVVWRLGSAPAEGSSGARMVVAQTGDGAVLPWDGDPSAFGDTEEAPEALARTRARVAALDRLLEASQEALETAPGDPVLQRSVQQAHAQREAALRALGGTLPASHQLVRY